MKEGRNPRTAVIALASLTVLVLLMASGVASAAPDVEPAPVRLTLLHNSNGESALLPRENTVIPGSGYPNTTAVNLQVAGISAFKAVVDRVRSAARAQHNAVLTVYGGDALLAGTVVSCSLPPEDYPIFDALALRQIPYTAQVFGNREFNFDPDFTEDFIRAYNSGTGLHRPFLSANLDFSAEPGFADLIDADGLIVEAPAANHPVARSMLVTDSETGQTFGIVGAITPAVRTNSSPRDVQVTPDLLQTATAAQQEIDRLQAIGINKIILVSHMLDLAGDEALIGLLSGVDLAVSGGGDALLAGSAVPETDQLLPGEEAELAGEYPLEFHDKNGQTVYTVATRGKYAYLGRLDAQFDALGQVTGIYAEASYPRRVIPDTPQNAAAIAALGLDDAVIPDAQMDAGVITPLNTCLAGFATSGIAFSEIPLDASQATVRGFESNAGNLIADAFLWAYHHQEPGVLIPAAHVVAAMNGGGILQGAGDALQGLISRSDTLSLVPFNNDVMVIQGLPPQTLAAVFEHAAAVGGGSGRFLQISGARVLYDRYKLPGQRVFNLTLADGTAVVAGGEIVGGAPAVDFVTNSFIAGGGDGYTMLAPLPKIPLLDHGRLKDERALLNYLTQDSTSFPLGGAQDLPHILEGDPRYQPYGEGRVRYRETHLLVLIYR